MKELLLFFLVYFAYLIVWAIINLIAYFASIAFKKRAIMVVILGFSVIVVQLLNFALGIGLLGIGITLLINGEFLWFILYFLFGLGIIGGILGWVVTLLQFPFIAVPSYFAEKAENLEMEEDIETAEIVDDKGKVLDRIEGNKIISTRLAKYFIAFFILNFISILLSREDRESMLLLDWVSTPFLQIIGGTLIFGIPYAIYYKLKYKSFFPKDKRYFFIQVWRLNLMILIPLGAIVYILAIMLGTL